MHGVGVSNSIRRRSGCCEEVGPGWQPWSTPQQIDIGQGDGLEDREGRPTGQIRISPTSKRARRRRGGPRGVHAAERDARLAAERPRKRR
jgi:hypothetical protein